MAEANINLRYENMELQSKTKSLWSSFKNAYLKSYNLKKFYKKIDKKNIPSELNETFNHFLNSQSYEWCSNFWKRLVINHLKLITSKNFDKSDTIIGKEFFTFTYFNDSLIRDACKFIENNEINLKVNIFKKQQNFSYEESINHNILLYLLYEIVRNKDVFKYFDELVKKNKSKNIPALQIDNKIVSQDDLNSLLEFEKITAVLEYVKNQNNRILEIGSGSGRTAKAILSIKKDIKYVIADIPPAINISHNNLKKFFPEKKVNFAYNKNPEELDTEIMKNDVTYIFPHQIESLTKKSFDIALAIDCLHEMEKKIIKKYIHNFENISKSFYFKVWEYAGLPNSFYKYYSIHKKEDYFIQDHWNEIFKERCIFPSNYYQAGYIF